MLKAIIISVLTLYVGGLIGQEHPYQIQFAHDIEQKIQEGSMRPSMVGNLLSLIGAYQASSVYSDIPVSWRVDTLTTATYKVVPALASGNWELSDQHI